MQRYYSHRIRAILDAAALTLGLSPAHAHHSAAMFDIGHDTVIQGTIKDFQWTSPHAWIMLTVDKRGRPEQWAIEMNGPSGLSRQGWQPTTLTPGMAVTATIRPLRDGTNGGQFLEIILPDGTVLGRATGEPR
jgi:hypothetical protein